MSDPIDYIDLTIDSPVNNALRLRSRNVDNITNNSTATKTRKRNSTKQQSTTIEIQHDNACKDIESMEIIDLDNTNSPGHTEKVHGVNDSTQENLVALTCPICYEELTSKMKPMSTRCGHIFCAKCLELSMRNAKRCPKCQKAVKLQSCTRLYF